MANLQREVDMEYNRSRKARDTPAEDKITFEQYQEMKQQITYDIAWQIFDEINEQNDTDKFIDLNCLEFDDAKAITKQKIYDVAREVQLFAREKRQSASSMQHVGPFDAKGHPSKASK